MYQVRLEEFEGPLDLLLFFIRRDELDIYDIPIARLTDQFIEYLHLMRELDLSVAAEFIWMASMLMSIKVKMMLPRSDAPADGELDETDPRFELVQALLEYKKYKEAASSLRDLDAGARKTYFRGNPDADRVDWVHDGEPLKDITLIDLMAVIRDIMKKMDAQPVVHTVQKVRTSIEEQSQFLIDRLRGKGRTSFMEVCRELPGREYVVVTFLAVLELIRQQLVQLFVDESPTDFFVEALEAARTA